MPSFQGGFGLLPVLLLQIGFAEEAIGLGIVGEILMAFSKCFYAFVGILALRASLPSGYSWLGWFGDGEIFDWRRNGLALGWDDDVCRRVPHSSKRNKDPKITKP